ncbi:MAG: SelB C-terminal domain-containing protein, partial [Candidatus Zixiibacteriota bacterium]
SELKGPVKEACTDVLGKLTKDPYAPPALAQLAAGGKHYREAVKFVIESGQAYKCGSEFLFLTDAWKEIVRFIRQKLTEVDSLAVADLRDRFGFTRKYAIPILEETDRLKLTRREGDIRVKGERFESQESDL